MNKKLALCLLTGIFLLTVCTGHLMAADRVWKIGHVRPAGSAIDKDLHQLAETLSHLDLMFQQVDKDLHQLAETLSRDGLAGIDFEIYPASKLGDYSVAQERCSFGEVEMFVGPFGTAVDRKTSLAFTPFLVTDWQQARRVYSPGSPMLMNMASILEKQNIKILGGWPVYFGGIALSSLPAEVKNPDIPKKTIIRVPPIKPFELTARAIGFTPYPITWFYAKEGFKTGMVAGIIGGGAEGYLGLKKHITHYLPLNDHFEYWFVYMNLDLWQSLSQDQQEKLVAAVRVMEEQRYLKAEAQEAESLQILEAQGTVIISLSSQETAAIQDKVRRIVWPEMRKEIGPMFDQVTLSADK